MEVRETANSRDSAAAIWKLIRPFRSGASNSKLLDTAAAQDFFTSLHFDSSEPVLVSIHVREHDFK